LKRLLGYIPLSLVGSVVEETFSVFYETCGMAVWFPTYCHVCQWLKMGFRLVIAFIDHLQVVTTVNVTLPRFL
jgi:hypothetical protein